MRRDVSNLIELLSQRSSYLLLQEMEGNPPLVANVLGRLLDSVRDWEDQGVMLDPVEFEVVTDVLVKQFAASFLAAQVLVSRTTCIDCGKKLEGYDDDGSG